MALTNSFYKAVKTNDVLGVRIMMKDSLLVDPTFRDFKEMEKVSSSMQGLYDLHDGKEFERNVEKWNDDYMNKQLVQVVNNFSHERIKHLKDVVQHLRPVAETTKSHRVTENKRTTTPESSGTKVATGAVAGAVIGGVTASAIGVTVVGGVVVGAAVGGAVVILNGGR